MSGTNIEAIVAQAVAAAMAAIGTPTQEKGTTGSKRKAPVKSGVSRKPGTTKPRTPKACITAGDAWLILGADETYKPKDMDKPANNAQLWRLNQAGLLRVAS